MQQLKGCVNGLNTVNPSAAARCSLIAVASKYNTHNIQYIIFTSLFANILAILSPS